MNPSFPSLPLAGKTKKVVFILLALCIGLGGCAVGGKPPYSIDTYFLDYTAPAAPAAETIPATLKFSRFSVAAAYNSTQMIFRKDAHRFDFFNYSRWAVNPGDMIADRLLRDIRENRLFEVVFARQAMEDGRFVVLGDVEDFFLRMDNDRGTAVIALTISLKDSAARNAGRKIIFQKKYRVEEPLPEASPYGYSRAASQAMKKISEQVIGDLWIAAKNRP
jgi:ABC-type uncharacterized transport system auxiliary subunit